MITFGELTPKQTLNPECSAKNIHRSGIIWVSTVECESISDHSFLMNGIQGITNRICYRGGRHIRSDPISQHHFHAERHCGTQIDHPSTGWIIRDVRSPKLVWLYLVNPPIQMVRVSMNRLLVMGIRFSSPDLYRKSNFRMIRRMALIFTFFCLTFSSRFFTRRQP